MVTMFRDGGVMRWKPIGRPEPTSAVHAQNGKMRPVGLAVDRCSKAVGPSSDHRCCCVLFGTNWYTRLLVTGKPFV